MIIKPRKVFLKGTVGEKISQTISIVPAEGESFKILKVNALKGGDFTYSLKEVKVDGKQTYELIVENVRKTAGRYYDKIVAITDRTDQKPITIIVSGYILKPKDLNPEEKDTKTVPATKPEAAGK